MGKKDKLRVTSLLPGLLLNFNHRAHSRFHVGRPIGRSVVHLSSEPYRTKLPPSLLVSQDFQLFRREGQNLDILIQLGVANDTLEHTVMEARPARLFAGSRLDGAADDVGRAKIGGLSVDSVGL